MTYIAFNQCTMENMSSVWSCFAAKIKQGIFIIFLSYLLKIGVHLSDLNFFDIKTCKVS